MNAIERGLRIAVADAFASVGLRRRRPIPLPAKAPARTTAVRPPVAAPVRSRLMVAVIEYGGLIRKELEHTAAGRKDAAAACHTLQQTYFDEQVTR